MVEDDKGPESNEPFEGRVVVIVDGEGKERGPTVKVHGCPYSTCYVQHITCEAYVKSKCEEVMLLNIMTCLTHVRVYRREGGRERRGREGGRENDC